MTPTWRLLDTGLASPARNIALDRALLEARRADEIPNTLRFFRCTRALLLGCNAALARSPAGAAGESRGIAVQRRLTGGAALHTDEGHLWWALFVHRRDAGPGSLGTIAQRIAHAVATAVAALGIDARFRAPADVEVAGATLGSGGLAVDGDALLFQGVLALEFRAGPVGDGSPGDEAGSSDARSKKADLRWTDVKSALGRGIEPHRIKHNLVEAFESEFDVEFVEGELTLSEERRLSVALAGIDTPDWIALVKIQGSSQLRE